MVAFSTIFIHKQRAAADDDHNKELFTDCGSEDVVDLTPSCCMTLTPLERMQSRVPQNESGGFGQLGTSFQPDNIRSLCKVGVSGSWLIEW